MANRDSTTNEQASTIALRPLHRSFSWLSDNVANDANARLAANTKTVTLGGMTIANLIRSDAMAADNGTQPLLSSNSLDCLVGLLIFSLETLYVSAEDQIDRLTDAANAVATKGAAK